MGRKGPNPSKNRVQPSPRSEFVRPRQGAGMALRASQLNLICATALAFAKAWLVLDDVPWRRRAA